MPHLPGLDTIIELSSSKSYGETKQLMTVLGDILLRTYGHQQSRMFFPANVLTAALCPEILECKVPKPGSEVEVNIEKFNFSGQGGFAAYEAVINNQFKMPESHTQEAAPHSSFIA